MRLCFSLTEDEMERYGIHLLALSHVYMVTQLKQRCSKGVVQRLTTENVVDVLQLARLCDAPDVCLRSMRLIHSQFKTVEQTEGWKFIQEHDPFLELDILQFIDDAESVNLLICFENTASLFFLVPSITHFVQLGLVFVPR